MISWPHTLGSVIVASYHGGMETLVHLATGDEITTCGYSGATSAECKTVITAVLTVTSGLDPHLISGYGLGWFWV